MRLTILCTRVLSFMVMFWLENMRTKLACSISDSLLWLLDSTLENVYMELAICYWIFRVFVVTEVMFFMWILFA